MLGLYLIIGHDCFLPHEFHLVYNDTLQYYVTYIQQLKVWLSSRRIRWSLPETLIVSYCHVMSRIPYLYIVFHIHSQSGLWYCTGCTINTVSPKSCVLLQSTSEVWCTWNTTIEWKCWAEFCVIAPPFAAPACITHCWPVWLHQYCQLPRGLVPSAMDSTKRPQETWISDIKLTGLWQRWNGNIMVGSMGT